MRYLVLLALFAGCAHESVSYETPLRPDSPALQPGPREMSKRQRFACAMSDGDVWNDEYGERCVHLRPQQASLTPQGTTTNCYRIGDSVHCTTN